MIKVTTKYDGKSGTVIIIEGKLSGDSVAVVEACCNEVGLDRKPVHLYLRDVNVVDHEGKSLLQRLARKGISLKASGVYTSYLIQSIRESS
jgi:hypothetical protein